LAWNSLRFVTADKARAGAIIRLDNKLWRIISSVKSQKGQMSTSYGIRLVNIVDPTRTKELTCPPSQDLSDARYERVRTLFSGFDDVDNACFVYPETSALAGTEINIKATSLPLWQQQWLAVRMNVDVLRVFGESEDDPDWFGDIIIPTNWTFTIEKLRMKGMYKLASFVECDAELTVPDSANLGDRVKVVIRTDGTASYNGKGDA
jgi:translation elongation factor P/translation initiation factor 5A